MARTKSFQALVQSQVKADKKFAEALLHEGVDAMLSGADFKLVRGSGNVFRDFGRPNADIEQARAVLAAKIIGVLNRRKISTRAAEKLTGVSRADLSRIRNARLKRFTLDRMITILGKLDEDMEVSIDVRRRGHADAASAATQTTRLSRMAKAKTKKKPSRLAKALLETAGDMRNSGLLDPASYRTITRRHLGAEAAKPARLSAAQIRQRGSEKRAKGRKHTRNRMDEN